MKTHGGGHWMVHGRSMQKRPDEAHDGEPKAIKRNYKAHYRDLGSRRPTKSTLEVELKNNNGKPASYKYLRVWGTPAVKRLVGDKLDSRSSLCSFIGYPKETAGYYFYDPSKQKVFVSNVVFLKRGFPTDTRRDDLLLEESSEAPHSNAGKSSAPTVSTDNVPILRRSARVPQPPERYGFLGVTS
ncbi:hypothetical protein Sango_0655900 [Sesamum angolense]|uniref:Retroviral polymerase SH3-like domain-containing protein n=1 Tax=Sesamum angolense TaxID=2727404 RepID=A0AAE1X714_9LAMI|nr:hypothetical protein Sango_0655900 [Sesamum angolense]